MTKFPPPLGSFIIDCLGVQAVRGQDPGHRFDRDTAIYSPPDQTRFEHTSGDLTQPQMTRAIALDTLEQKSLAPSGHSIFN